MTPWSGFEPTIFLLSALRVKYNFFIFILFLIKSLSIWVPCGLYSWYWVTCLDYVRLVGNDFTKRFCCAVCKWFFRETEKIKFADFGGVFDFTNFSPIFYLCCFFWCKTKMFSPISGLSNHFANAAPWFHEIFSQFSRIEKGVNKMLKLKQDAQTVSFSISQCFCKRLSPKNIIKTSEIPSFSRILRQTNFKKLIFTNFSVKSNWRKVIKLDFTIFSVKTTSNKVKLFN